MTLKSMFLLCGLLLFTASSPHAHADQGKLLYTFKNGFELRLKEHTRALTYSIGHPTEKWHRSETIQAPEGFELRELLAGITNNLSEALPDSAVLTPDPIRGGSVAFYFFSLSESKTTTSFRKVTQALLVADSTGSWNWILLNPNLSPKNQKQQKGLTEELLQIGKSFIDEKDEPKLSSNEFTYRGYGLRAFAANGRLFVFSAFGIYSLGPDLKKKNWHTLTKLSFEDMPDTKTFVLKRNGHAIPIYGRDMIFQSTQNMIHTGKRFENFNPPKMLDDPETRALLSQELDRFPYLEFTDTDLVVDFIVARTRHLKDQDAATRQKKEVIYSIGKNIHLAVIATYDLPISVSAENERIKFPIIESSLCEILSAGHATYLHGSHRFGLRYDRSPGPI